MSQLNDTILAIGRCSTQFRSEKMAEFGLKACHTSYLVNICSYPGISQDRLAQMIYFNKSNVARQCAVLEEQGYITRQPSATDKRVMELYPTEKATALLPQINAILQEWDDMLTDTLSPADTATVTQLLSAMKEKAATWMDEH